MLSLIFVHQEVSDFNEHVSFVKKLPRWSLARLASFYPESQASWLLNTTYSWELTRVALTGWSDSIRFGATKHGHSCVRSNRELLMKYCKLVYWVHPGASVGWKDDFWGAEHPLQACRYRQSYYHLALYTSCISPVKQRKALHFWGELYRLILILREKKPG